MAVDARAKNKVTRYIENGSRLPSLEAIERLAEALDVEPSYFLRELKEDDPPALLEFLETSAANGITEEELDKLRNLRGAGLTPTPASYAIALTALRMRERRN